jgi:hypothetical protein
MQKSETITTSTMKLRAKSLSILTAVVAGVAIVFAGAQRVCACGVEKKFAYEGWLKSLAGLLP